MKKIFKQHDEKNHGYVNLIQFDYLMTQYCKVGEDDLEVLRNFFDPSGTGQVNYREVLNILDDPNLISSYPVRDMDYILSEGLKK